jgi:hypothetical protein
VREADFFIGWSPRLAPALGRFLLLCAATVLGGAVLLGLLLGGTADDPAGPDRVAPAEGPLTLAGFLLARPAAILVVPPDAAHPRGQAVLLAGEGKHGADAAEAGQLVTASGFGMARGSIAMLVLEALPAALPGSVPAPPVEKLGRWRITGEICDGKCAAGAMRPGSGLAHRACAVLCLDGGLPAVFVATAPVAGSGFLLLADADGGPPGPSLLARTGLRVTLEGEVERLADLLVFRVAAAP